MDTTVVNKMKKEQLSDLWYLPDGEQDYSKTQISAY